MYKSKEYLSSIRQFLYNEEEDKLYPKFTNEEKESYVPAKLKYGGYVYTINRVYMGYNNSAFITLDTSIKRDYRLACKLIKDIPNEGRKLNIIIVGTGTTTVKGQCSFGEEAIIGTNCTFINSLINGDTFITDGSTIMNSVIGVGSVIIGSNIGNSVVSDSEITDSFVGGCRIGDGCLITNSSIDTCSIGIFSVIDTERCVNTILPHHYNNPEE